MGSSAEGLKFAYAVQSNLEHDATVTVWSQDVFKLSKSSLTSLVASLDDFDFAAFVFSSDDVVLMRNDTFHSARDNVFFECGLFIGRLTEERTFFLVPRNVSDFHIPSDLLGITAGTYDHERADGNWMAALGPACDQIRRKIKPLWDRGVLPMAKLVSPRTPAKHPEVQMLERVMQSGFFSGIDEQFWLIYCQRMRTNDPAEAREIAEKLAAARDTKKLVIPKEDVYVLMTALFKRIANDGQVYHAIATIADIEAASRNADSKYFLFDVPLEFPHSLKRLFILESQKKLAQLEPGLRELLRKQIEAKVSLKLLESSQVSANFGVYGRVAVGVLNTQLDRNEMNFDETEVIKRLQDFVDLWGRPHAIPITPELIA